MPKHKMKKVMPYFILPKELLEIIFSFSNKEDSLNFSQTCSLSRSTFWNSPYSIYYRLKKETNEIFEQNSTLTTEKYLNDLQELIDFQQNRILCLNAKKIVIERFKNWNVKEFMMEILPEINNKEMEIFLGILENTHYTLKKIECADYITLVDVSFHIITENEKIKFSYDAYDDEGCNPRWNICQGSNELLQFEGDISIHIEELKSLKKKLNLDEICHEKMIYFVWKLIPFGDHTNFCYMERENIRNFIKKLEEE
jgi:hypothetical protein